jgi:hypothetical protein
MHDCREVESRLIDLVFDELEADEKLRLLSETESCASCLTARRNMTGALVVFDRAVEVASPNEDYWRDYDERLNRKLRSAGAIAPETRAPFWKRIFAVSLPVPVPVAAVIMIALLVSTALALRPSSTEAAVAATPQVQATDSSATLPTAPVKIVEVPVVTERVVTRVVYVEMKGREKTETRSQPALVAQSKSVARAPHAEDEQSGFITRANLTGFEPTSEVKIRMIRRSDEVEK